MKRNYTTQFRKIQLLTKSVRQLKNISNSRRKQGLVNRVQRLFKQLKGSTAFQKVKPALLTSMMAVGFSFGTTDVVAQNFFAAPELNPFGFETFGDGEDELLFIPSFADLDDDGDLDMLFSGRASPEYSQNHLHYYENTGTATSPKFETIDNDLISNSFPENAYYTNPAIFTDLDGDGDFDVLHTDLFYKANSNEEEYGMRFHYYENIGTKSSPAFAPSVESPFNLSFFDGQFFVLSSLSSVDIDDDGDLDIVSNNIYYEESFVFYHENIGSAENPNFKNPIEVKPDWFGNTTVTYLINSSFVDMDNDGDQDVFYGTYYDEYEGSPILYFENIGTGENVKFKEGVENPFNLEPEVNYITAPVAVDIDSDGDVDFIEAPFGFLQFYENTNNAPDEAPIVRNSTIEMKEDEPYTFQESDFVYEDANLDPLIAVIIETLPTKGQLLDGDIAIDEGYEVQKVDLNTMVYVPEKDGFGENYDSFKVRVFTGSDDAEPLESINAGTITVNVIEVFDAPSFVLDYDFVQECDPSESVVINISNINAGDGDPTKLSFSVSSSNETVTENLQLNYQNGQPIGTVSFTPGGNSGETATITIVAENEGVSYSEEIIYAKNLCTGLEDVTFSNELTLFPNPAQNIVYVKFNDAFVDMEFKMDVFDVTGSRLISAPLNSTSIDVSKLLAGTYIVGMRFENEVHYKKLIVQK